MGTVRPMWCESRLRCSCDKFRQGGMAKILPMSANVVVMYWFHYFPEPCWFIYIVIDLFDKTRGKVSSNGRMVMGFPGPLPSYCLLPYISEILIITALNTNWKKAKQNKQIKTKKNREQIKKIFGKTISIGEKKNKSKPNKLINQKQINKISEKTIPIGEKENKSKPNK